MNYRTFGATLLFASLLALNACGQAPAASQPTSQPATAVPATALPTVAVPATALPTIAVPATAIPTSQPATAVPTNVPTVAATATAADECAAVNRIAANSPEAQAIGAALLRNLPADRSVGAIETIYGVDQLDDWVIFEASFTQAEAGLLLLRQQDAGYQLVAAWGGPVTEANQIQAYLGSEAPDAPKALLGCLNPKLGLFQFPR